MKLKVYPWERDEQPKQLTRSLQKPLRPKETFSWSQAKITSDKSAASPWSMYKSRNRRTISQSSTALKKEALANSPKFLSMLTCSWPDFQKSCRSEFEASPECHWKNIVKSNWTPPILKNQRISLTVTTSSNSWILTKGCKLRLHRVCFLIRMICLRPIFWRWSSWFSWCSKSTEFW